MQASGLAAVWAEENTRTAIFDAMQRKEVYGTTGPRIRLRFFAGNGLKVEDLDRDDWHSYLKTKAVPMGGNLITTSDTAPDFLLQQPRILCRPILTASKSSRAGSAKMAALRKKYLMWFGLRVAYRAMANSLHWSHNLMKKPVFGTMIKAL